MMIIGNPKQYFPECMLISFDREGIACVCLYLSGSLEEPEIRAMLHDILLKMPALKGAFGNGDITVEDTKPYVDDMLKSILEEFDDDGDKTISKTEISDISAAITTLVRQNFPL